MLSLYDLTHSYSRWLNWKITNLQVASICITVRSCTTAFHIHENGYPALAANNSHTLDSSTPKFHMVHNLVRNDVTPISTISNILSENDKNPKGVDESLLHSLRVSRHSLALCITTLTHHHLSTSELRPELTTNLIHMCTFSIVIIMLYFSITHYA